MHLTERMIIARSKQSDLSTIKRMNLWGCELTDISIISSMTNIEVLALSVNNLSCLKPLEACTKLQELYLRKNNIQDFNQLVHLQKLPLLKHLCLAENPCCLDAGTNYRACVLNMLPNLKKLDEDLITSEDIKLAKKLHSPQIQPEPSSDSVCLDKGISKTTSEPHIEPAIKEPSSISPQTSRKCDTANPMQNLNGTQQFQASSETQESNSGDCLPELCARQQNSPELEVSKPSNCKALESPNKSISSERSIDSDRKGENLNMSFAMPASNLSSANNEQPLDKELQFSGLTHSQNPMQQLNLIVQIHQCQSGLEIPLNLSHTTTMQTININTNYAGEQQNQDRSYNMDEEQNVCDDYDEFCENGTDTPRSRAPLGYPCKLERTAKQSQGNQRVMGLENTARTPRSNRKKDSSLCEDALRSSPNTKLGNANILSGLLCIVSELDAESLQILDHSVKCRIDELSLN